MNFDLNKSIEILERTPLAIEQLLSGSSEEWTMNNEGPETWSPYDVMGHLIHGEQTDWIGRMEIILSDKEDKTFVPFDRFAMFEESKGKTLSKLIDEFKAIRTKNIETLKSKNLSKADLNKKGIHPKFGEVTLSQLLATWVVHDLGHLGQISRVMAKQYKDAIGPWIEYLRIVRD